MFRPLLVFLPVFLSACASLSISPILVAPTTTGRPDAVIRIDARPGEYRKYGTTFDQSGKLPTPVRFEFTFLKLQPAAKWEPNLALCFLADKNVSTTCISFRINRATPSQLESRVFYNTNADSPTESKPLPVVLSSSGTNSVDVTFTEQLVIFKLNNMIVHQQPVAHAPNALSMSCSSAVCEIAIYDPPDRP